MGAAGAAAGAAGASGAACGTAKDCKGLERVGMPRPLSARGCLAGAGRNAAAAERGKPLGRPRGRMDGLGV